jgi:thiamine biosynthesis lipoprotein
VRYGHIIDPRTGWPAREVASVVVVAPRGADADALATGLFVLGVEKGLALVEKISSVEALFVVDDGNVRSSTGLSLHGDTMERIE